MRGTPPEVGALYTDGVDLSLGVILSLKKQAWDQPSTILTSALGALNLKAMQGSGGYGRLSFEGALLGGKSCVVQSEPLAAGFVVAIWVSLRGLLCRRERHRLGGLLVASVSRSFVKDTRANAGGPCLVNGEQHM